MKFKHLKPAVKFLIFIHFLIWCIFFLSFWSLAYTHDKSGGIVAQSLGTWADGAAHLTYTSNLAYRPNLPKYLPVYFGQPFIYPMLPDGLAAIFVRIGMNLFSAYALVGAALSLVFIYVLYWFYFKLFKRHGIAIISSNLTLLSGGLGFIRLWFDIQDRGWDILSKLPREYTRMDDAKVYWINIITGELIPQRAFLLALPLGLYILWIMWRLTQKQSVNRFQLGLAGLFYGLMPIIHPHTFIVLTLFTGLCLLFYLPFKRMADWATLLLPAILIATPFVLRIRSTTQDSTFFKYYPGWLAPGNDLNWFHFWFINLGIFPIMGILGYLKLPRKYKRFLLPFPIIFALANLYLFQPYDWDNSKLITWVHLIFSGIIGYLLVSWWDSKKILVRLIVIPCIVLLTIAGTIDVVRQLQSAAVNVPMYSAEELGLAEWVKANTSPNSIFLTSDSHTHPVSSLTGRQIVMGYRGWLWSYGINYSVREKQVSDIFLGRPDTAAILNSLHVNYVVIGPSERSDMHANQGYFLTNYSRVYTSPNYYVFQITPVIK